MIAPGGTVYVDGRPACVLAVELTDEYDPATGERAERATVLQFGRPVGRDHLCGPTLRIVIVTGAEQYGPPRSRHNDVRTLCAWLGGQRRAMDTRQAALVAILPDLARLSS